MPEEVYESIEEIREAEQADRSTTIKRLLERGIEDWRIDTAVCRYQDGELSLGRAAELAGVSLWRFLDTLEDRGIGVNYTEADLEADVAAIRDE